MSDTETPAVARTTVVVATPLIPFVAHHHPELRFDGNDITSFLKDYERNARNAGWSNAQICSQVISFCDKFHAAFIAKLPEYKSNDWIALQEQLKEHHAAKDHAQFAGNRTYLETFVNQCHKKPLETLRYYAEFLAIADACIAQGQIYEAECGWYYFRGLGSVDQNLVLFNMPKKQRPKGGAMATFNFAKIARFVRESDNQRRSMDDCSPAHRAVDIQRAKLAHSQSDGTGLATAEEIARSIIDQGKQEEKTELPDGVDVEVEEVIRQLGGLTLSLEQFNTFSQHPTMARLFQNSANIAYAVKRIIHPEPASNHRNDGSYLSSKPKTVNFSGTRTYDGKEYPSMRCLMCGSTDGHRVKDCTMWQALRSRGWAFSTQVDIPGGRKLWEYHFGHFNADLGEMPGRAPTTYILDWIKEKCREFFNVSDDDFGQSARERCPDKFNMAAAPKHILRRPESTNAIVPSGTSAMSSDLEADYLQFMDSMEEDGLSSNVHGLDATDREFIILNDLFDAHANAAGRTDGPTRHGANHPVRGGRVTKTPPTLGPTVRIPVTHRSQTDDFEIHPRLRGSSRPATPSDGETLPDAQRIPETPGIGDSPPTLGWEVCPDDINSPDAVISVPAVVRRKRTPQGSDIEQIQEQVSSDPARSIIHALQQEVRGLNVADLIAFPRIRNGLKEFITEYERRERADAGDRHGSSQVNAIATTHGNRRQIQSNSLMKHQVRGVGDSWINDLERIPHEALDSADRAAGITMIACELPTCWAYFDGHRGKCLIDSGSMLNVMRYSAAKALGITIEEHHRAGEGVITANGSIDPYVGTAWDVPVTIGLVKTLMNFRIVRGLTRSIILGTPWCAATRMGMHWSASGRCEVRILSPDGHHNATFTAVEPPLRDLEGYVKHPGIQGNE